MISDSSYRFAKFLSTVFSPLPHEYENVSDAVPPWGEDCVTFIGDSLRRHKGVKIVGNPYLDSDAWNIEIAIGEEHYDLFVTWVPKGRPSVNYCGLEIWPKVSLLRRLLRCERPLQHERELLDMIARVLQTTQGISDVRWMNENEYKGFRMTE